MSSTDECLLVKRVRESSYLPVRTSDQAAGYDLSSSENIVVAGGSVAVIKTGLELKSPKGTYGRIVSRSGLAFHHRITAEGNTL